MEEECLVDPDRVKPEVFLGVALLEEGIGLFLIRKAPPVNTINVVGLYVDLWRTSKKHRN